MSSRKLEEILGEGWFDTVDIFFIDEEGPQYKNWEPGDKHEFKNSLNAVLALQGVGAAAAYRSGPQVQPEKVYRSDKGNVVNEGPFGADRALVSKIAVENEFLGCVVAYPMLANDLNEQATRRRPKSWRRPTSSMRRTSTRRWASLKVIAGSDLEYFKQLVDLVAQGDRDLPQHLGDLRAARSASTRSIRSSARAIATTT